MIDKAFIPHKLERGVVMKSYKAIVVWVSFLLLLAGCASTKITQRDEIVTGQIPRPDTIWVRDFAATGAPLHNPVE